MEYQELDETTLNELANENDSAALCEKGMRLYEKACQIGSPEDGLKESAKYLHLSMQLGYNPACYPLGRVYLDLKNFDKALDAFREGRRGGDDESAYGFAVVMLFQEGDSESLSYLVSLANEGDAQSARVLQEYYIQSGNKREAEYWHKKEKDVEKEKQK